jgi:hypothetical protein
VGEPKSGPLAIKTPTCPNCRCPMWLVRIEPDRLPDHDRRLFECFECGQTKVLVVRYREPQ